MMGWRRSQPEELDVWVVAIFGGQGAAEVVGATKEMASYWRYEQKQSLQKQHLHVGMLYAAEVFFKVVEKKGGQTRVNKRVAKFWVLATELT